jgi:hypothetical protein
MYSFDKLPIIRAFDLLMFGGVPETPEQMYEGETNPPNPYTESRPTRQSLLAATQNGHGNGEIIEEFEIDLDTWEITAKSSDPTGDGE